MYLPVTDDKQSHFQYSCYFILFYFILFFCCCCLHFQAMAEFAQLKVELARALEAQTGSQSEQMNLAQRTSELVRK